jgi:threonine dehydrogenase-like Zn-dependent dehydrogenase
VCLFLARRELKENDMALVQTGITRVQSQINGLAERNQKGEIDPSFIITHRLNLNDGPQGYNIFKHKEDDCVKIVLKP